MDGCSLSLHPCPFGIARHQSTTRACHLRRDTGYGHRRLPLPVQMRAAGREPPPPPPPSGDPYVQQKLVDIVRLETDKVRVSDYIDEQSKHLSDIAEQAMVEYDRFATDTARVLDAASAQAMQTIEEDMQAVEAQLESARAEIEAREEELDAFEKSIATARSEGLFFKSLYKPSKPWKDRDPREQQAIKEEVKNLSKTTKTHLSSKSRQILFIALICALLFIVVEGITSPDASWPRLIICSAVIVLLMLQLSFEKSFSSEQDDTLDKS